MFEHINFNSLSNYIFLQLVKGNGTLLFTNQGQKIVVVLLDLVVVLLLCGIEQNPYVEIFALWFLYTLDQTVWSKGFEDFINHDRRIIGSFLDIIFCWRMFLNQVVNSPIVLSENCRKNSMDTLLLFLTFGLHFCLISVVFWFN